MTGPDHRKIMRAVLSAVADLPPSLRLSVLHAAWQLAVQKIYEQHVEEMRCDSSTKKP